MSREGKNIPAAAYHGVPLGWRKREMLAAHQQLRGAFSIDGPKATEPGAPEWMTEREEWLQYRATLRLVAEGARAGDGACVELAVRYIVLNFKGSYSGYLKSLLARSLKHAPLEPPHQRRLHKHFSELVLSGERSPEFKDHVRLWRQIITDDKKQDLLRILAQQNDKLAAWLAPQLDRSAGR